VEELVLPEDDAKSEELAESDEEESEGLIGQKVRPIRRSPPLPICQRVFCEIFENLEITNSVTSRCGLQTDIPDGQFQLMSFSTCTQLEVG
jgi:hypothetical protein